MNDLITGFTLAPTWVRGAAWRRSDASLADLFAGGRIAEAARRAEKAGYDFLFRPDAQELDPARIVSEPGQLGLDPVVQLAAIAGATKRISLFATLSATFADPFTVARQLASLEHLAGPRIGWNIVTSLGGDRNHAVPRGTDSASRWRRAEEFLHVVESLRSSFPLSAVRFDRAGGRFADSDGIRPIDHVGESFRIAGPALTPSVRAGRLPLLQAGGSPAGVAFAGRHADAVFTAAPRSADAAALRARVRAAADAAGRAQDAVAVLCGLSVFLGDDPAEAWGAFRAAQSPAQLARRRHVLAERIAADLDDLDADGPIPAARLRTGAEDPELRALAEDGWTLTALLEHPLSIADLHWTVVGTPHDVAEAVAERRAADAIDGVIVFPGGWWRSVELATGPLPALLG